MPSIDRMCYQSRRTIYMSDTYITGLLHNPAVEPEPPDQFRRILKPTCYLLSVDVLSTKR